MVLFSINNSIISLFILFRLFLLNINYVWTTSITEDQKYLKMNPKQLRSETLEIHFLYIFSLSVFVGHEVTVVHTRF